MIKRKNRLAATRKTRVRSKLKVVSSRPRLSVFRSNKHIYAQIIDDSQGQTLVSASEKTALATNAKTSSSAHTTGKTQTQSKTQKARLVGKALAQKAMKKNITKVSFDRGPYKFHGRIKALAQEAISNGLEF